MKTCPVCGDTYSERIDFCFSDGAALALMPSALDAPVPRMARGGVVSPGRLHTGQRDDEAFHDATAPTVSVPAPPASAEEVPEPPRMAHGHDDTTHPVVQVGDEDDTVIGMPAVAPTAEPQPAPLPPAVPAQQPVVSAPIPEMGDDLPPGESPPARSAVGWFLASSALFAALVFALWTTMAPGPTHTPAAPTPVAVPTPAEVATPPTEPVAPPAEPAPTPPAPAETVPPPAPRTPEPPAKRDPVVRVVSRPIEAAPLPSERTRATTPAPVVRTSQPAEAVGASPWDAPAAPEDAVAEIDSDPQGAVVRVDGRLRGKTPMSVRLSYGSHELELELDGYELASRRIDVKSAAPKYPFSLVPSLREGNVLVLAPGWDGATLYVDGKRVGDLPVELRLAEGAHTFEVRDGSRRGSDRREVSLAARGLTRLTLSPRATGTP